MKYLISFLMLPYLWQNCGAQSLFPFKTDGLWGYQDETGWVKITPEYQFANKFRYGVGIVAKQGKLGAIDKKNRLMLPFEYEFLQPLDSTEFLFGYRARYFGEFTMGVLTADAKVKIPAEYSYISKQHGMYQVSTKQDSILEKSPSGDVRSFTFLYGLYDSEGRITIPCQYSYIEWVNDTLLVVSEAPPGINQALFTNTGQQLTGFDYLVFGKFIAGLGKVRIGDKFGFIHLNGKIAIPVIFDYCEDFDTGYALIRQGSTWGAINQMGEVVIKPLFEYEKAKSLVKRK